MKLRDGRFKEAQEEGQLPKSKAKECLAEALCQWEAVVKKRSCEIRSRRVGCRRRDGTKSWMRQSRRDV